MSAERPAPPNTAIRFQGDMVDFLQNYTVGRRLTAGFSRCCCFAIVAMVAIATHGLNVTRQHLDQVVNLNGEKTRLLSEMMESQAGTAVARRDFLLAPDQPHATPR
jgi:hypothetical protein